MESRRPKTRTLDAKLLETLQASNVHSSVLVSVQNACSLGRELEQPFWSGRVSLSPNCLPLPGALMTAETSHGHRPIVSPNRPLFLGHIGCFMNWIRPGSHPDGHRLAVAVLLCSLPGSSDLGAQPASELLGQGFPLWRIRNGTPSYFVIRAIHAWCLDGKSIRLGLMREGQTTACTPYLSTKYNLCSFDPDHPEAQIGPRSWRGEI